MAPATKNEKNNNNDNGYPIYVLYASQMGNSEGAANDLSKKLVDTLTVDYFKKNKLNFPNNNTSISPMVMSMDDFLEIHHAKYTPILLIITSSYGVGQAPLGGYRFRDVCDYWMKNKDNYSNDNDDEKLFNGLQYAICGLGDSSYVTYLENPKKIDKALQFMGAKPILELVPADANAMKPTQQESINSWMQQLWLPLAKAISNTATTPTKEQLQTMQQATIEVLVKINPDYTPPPFTTDSSSSSSSTTTTSTAAMVIVPILVMAIAIVAANVGMIFSMNPSEEDV